MAKVDWITWKTDPKEIINPEKIEEKINDCYKNYDSYMKAMIYEQLYNEMTKGGLTKDAFNVSGIHPANEMAVDIVNTIDEIKYIMKSLLANVKEEASKQKEIEKDQLIQAIEEKIEKEKFILKNVESRKGLQEKIEELGNNPEDIKNVIHDRINKLTERLEMAKQL